MIAVGNFKLKFKTWTTLYIVSLAAVLSVVTCGEKRCVTTLKMAERETTLYMGPCRLEKTVLFLLGGGGGAYLAL